jgi:predicted phosphohydrolase
MKVFAIGDLHLSLSSPFIPGEKVVCYKPMDIFGDNWRNHTERLYANWLDTVSPADAVLVPGDISWGMKLLDCRYDWDFLSALSGTIYICRGNHDYWWQGLAKIRRSLPSNVIPLNHSSALVGGKTVCATRGWTLPGGGEWSKEDETIYQRELLRLTMALEEGQKNKLPLVAMLHYAPCSKTGEGSDFTALLRKYSVEMCIYGHFHGEDHKKAFQGDFEGIKTLNVSGDALDFKPLLLWEY